MLPFPFPAVPVTFNAPPPLPTMPAPMLTTDTPWSLPPMPAPPVPTTVSVAIPPAEITPSSIATPELPELAPLPPPVPVTLTAPPPEVIRKPTSLTRTPAFEFPTLAPPVPTTVTVAPPVLLTNPPPRTHTPYWEPPAASPPVPATWDSPVAVVRVPATSTPTKPPTVGVACRLAARVMSPLVVVRLAPAFTSMLRAVVTLTSFAPKPDEPLTSQPRRVVQGDDDRGRVPAGAVGERQPGAGGGIGDDEAGEAGKRLGVADGRAVQGDAGGAAHRHAGAIGGEGDHLAGGVEVEGGKGSSGGDRHRGRPVFELSQLGRTRGSQRDRVRGMVGNLGALQGD